RRNPKPKYPKQDNSARGAATPCARRRNQKKNNIPATKLRAAPITPARGVAARRKTPKHHTTLRAAQHRLRVAQMPEAAEKSNFKAKT
ncbi:hypothetical protein A2U01_0064805, partial [Trifolium medium]|nr:hypothetical protein [Trifolium medium]